jgi:hypothetical protein
MASALRRFFVALLAALIFLTAAGSSFAQVTLKQGDMISGRLRLVKTRHFNGTPIRAYQIVADAPKKFAEKDEFCGEDPPQIFHLLVLNDRDKEARLKRDMGKKIAVIGVKFFCSQTAWHIGDAVVTQWRFAEPADR